MVLLNLFISFVKIGFTSFGGLSMIPLITSEMTTHQWMTSAEVSDIVAIAEMTPGPLGLNCATFAGIRTAGIAGAVAANLGALTPTLTLCLLAAQGGCEPQLTSHAAGNMRVGNSKEFLIKIISQCLPYLGYPRSLNALRCVNEAAK